MKYRKIGAKSIDFTSFTLNDSVDEGIWKLWGVVKSGVAPLKIWWNLIYKF